MTQRGREPVTETFSVRLSPTDFQEFEELARDKGVGRSILARQVIIEWLHQQRRSRKDAAHKDADDT